MSTLRVTIREWREVTIDVEVDDERIAAARENLEVAPAEMFTVDESRWSRPRRKVVGVE